jgi:hypothetical protein
MTYEPRLGELRQLLNPKEADVHSDSELRTRNENSPSHVRRAAALPYAGGWWRRAKAPAGRRRRERIKQFRDLVGKFYASCCRKFLQIVPVEPPASFSNLLKNRSDPACDAVFNYNLAAKDSL